MQTKNRREKLFYNDVYPSSSSGTAAKPPLGYFKTRNYQIYIDIIFFTLGFFYIRERDEKFLLDPTSFCFMYN